MKNIAFFVIAINLIASNVQADDIPSKAIPNEKLAQDYFADISDISGTWNPVSLDYGSPTLVNLAHTVGGHQTISFKFFPIEYCQAIRVCTTPNQPIGVEFPFTVTEKMCEEYFDFSPATGKFVHYLRGKVLTNCFVDDLTFLATNGPHIILCSDTPFYRTASRKDKPKEKYISVLQDKLFIVMSNSRQCQVNIVLNGKLEYSDMLIAARTKNTTKLPTFFHYGGSVDAIPTFYTKTSSEQKRAQDLLPRLKSLTKTSTTFKHIEFKCLVGYGIGNGFSPINKPSIIHVEKQRVNAATSGDSLKIERIIIETEQCHWIRLWFTAAGTAWDKYATKIGNEIHQTIDLFFEEGFALLPDRENSIRLPGGSKDIESIGIYHHGDGLAEISFGYINNKRINSIHFKLNILKEDTYSMFLIRAPHCDANFGSDLVGDGMFARAERILNPILLKECNVYSIEKP